MGAIALNSAFRKAVWIECLLEAQMRELVSSFASFCLAKTLSTSQGIAKALGASSSLVVAKNPPGPGPDAKTPPTLTGRLYHETKKTAETFGDPAAVAFIALDEYL